MTVTPISHQSRFTRSAQTVVPPASFPPTQSRNGFISLAYGFPDPSLYPGSALQAASQAILEREKDQALAYGPVDPALVTWIEGYMRAQGVRTETKQLMVAHGSSQLLTLLPGIFIEPGDLIVVEQPTFMGAVDRFIRGGATLVPIRMDADGMDVEMLEHKLAALARRGRVPKLIYTIPTFHNPTGVCMSLARRERLVALAAHYGIFVVEDDAYGSLWFDHPPLPSLASLDQDGWVIYINTFSKLLAPGLRLAWVHAHATVIERLAMVKPEGDNSPFLTRLVAHFCHNTPMEGHLAMLRCAYRSKAHVMLETIRQEFPRDLGLLVTPPAGGFFVWCALPPGVDAGALLQRATSLGTDFIPGTRCFTAPEDRASFRLAFSYETDDRMKEGLSRLAAALCSLSPRQARVVTNGQEGH